jgi:hypothetical protein
MTAEAQGCDLCGLPVPKKAYHVETVEGERTFCCEGCLGIWTMLNGDAAEPAARQPADERRKP